MPPVPSRLTDISETGLLVTGTTFAADDRQVVLTLRLRGREDQPCSANGRVVRRPPTGLAVEFIDTNDAFREFIGDLGRMRFELRQDFLANIIDPRIELT